MNLYSQHDPAYDRLTLGTSNLTIHGFGCFLCSIATLYQVSPKDLLQLPNIFNAQGLLFPGTLAAAFGGTYADEGSSKPDGWCIAMTNHYASLGYPTHFFCVNPQTKQQIDPLKFPAIVEPLSYEIKDYRSFTNIKLDLSVPPAGPTIAGLTKALQWTQGFRKRLIERTLKRLQKPS